MHGCVSKEGLLVQLSPNLSQEQWADCGGSSLNIHMAVSESKKILWSIVEDYSGKVVCQVYLEESVRFRSTGRSGGVIQMRA